MKKKERVLWLIPVFAFLVGMSACSADFTKNDQKQPPSDKAYLKEIEKVYKMIQQLYVEDVESKKLYEGAIRGMLSALGDPHSSYLDQDTFTGMTKDLLKGEYGGVGLYINKANPKSLTPASLLTDYYIQIIAPIKGTPGYHAELHAGDFITHIDGNSVVKLTSREAVKQLTGKVGTDVTVTILRGKDFIFDVTLTRAHIEVPTVEHAIINDSIGYLRLISWTQHTPADVAKALSEFKTKNTSSIIVDVRENGGGLLEAAYEISNFFISKGTIVSTKYRSSLYGDKSLESNSWQTKVKKEVPIIVLIDKGSASASEIFSAAMQDTGRAYLIGQTSYGKGSVQIPYELSYSDAIKLTVGKYYTPSGKNIDKIGIVPDKEIKKEEFSDEELASFKKLLSEKLIDIFVNQNPVSNRKIINRYISKLQKDGIALSTRTLNKLIRNKYNRKMDFPPIFDLEYDTVLQSAIEVLKTGIPPHTDKVSLKK